jgi:hypothetical protein
MSRETVTACVIATDEEARLPAALRSVAFCDEVIVVDGGSRDGTIAAARAGGAEVIENPWPGFGAQRNVAIDHATSDWILEIDADERVTAELEGSILRLLEAPPSARLCGAPIREQFLGRRLGPSAKYPNYRLRLFRRGAYRHDETRTVHEGLVPDGPVHPLEGDLEHVLADTWGEALRDVWTYARLEAAQTPRRRGLRSLVLRPTAKLLYRLVVDGGWRDGWRGAARIGLDCATDVLVAARSGRGPVRAPQARALRRIVAVAPARDHGRAISWLEAARAAGADVALVSDAAAAGDVRTRIVPRLGPLHVIRALTAESQLGGIDRIVAGARIARLVPAPLRGGAPVIGLYEPASSERTTEL